MTDFSARLTEPSNLDVVTAANLDKIRDDDEVIASVTANLYPGWAAKTDGSDDPQYEDGRATWHGIVEELTGTRND